MGEVLSQDEIDNLLKALSTGEKYSRAPYRKK